MAKSSYADWLSLRKPPADWETLFQSGSGEILASETPSYALVAGYLHRFVDHGSVLDAGCGEGTLSGYLDVTRLSYIGFDVSRTAVARARGKLRDAHVFECSIDEFQPTAGQKYDAIVFKGSLPSLDDPLGEIERYQNFLASRGIIVVCLYVNPNESGNSSLLSHFLEAACSTGRFHLLERADVTSVTHGRSWRIFVLSNIKAE